MEPTTRQERVSRCALSSHDSFLNSGCVRLIAAGASDKVFLTVEGFRVGHYRGIASVGLEFTCLGVVSEVSVKQDVSQVALRLRVGNRRHYFDAMLQISRHQVGTADVDLLVAAVREPEDTAVLEKTTHDSAHAYILGQAGN